MTQWLREASLWTFSLLCAWGSPDNSPLLANRPGCTGGPVPACLSGGKVSRDQVCLTQQKLWESREKQNPQALKQTSKGIYSVSAWGVGRGQEEEPLSARNPESADSKNKNHTS